MVDRDGRRDRLGHVLRHPVRVLLAAILVGAVICAGVVAVLGGFDDPGKVDGEEIGDAKTSARSSPFSESVAGDCLTWPVDLPAKQSKVDCAAEHMFEVAGSVDTAAYPGVQFGEDAPWPTAEQFTVIRDEHCPVVVNNYLGGQLDPAGRFSVGLMYPSQQQWTDGERSLRCGLQLSGTTGTLKPFAGPVRDQDQSQQWPEGTCIGIDPATRKPTDPVDCAEPHAFQVTSVVDLSARFDPTGAGAPYPPVAEQDNYLKTTCPDVTSQFLGGPDKLTQTTLNLQWSTLAEPSWLAGSRKVVCYIGLPDQGGFATLVGDAAAGNLLINGKVPTPPPVEPPGRLIPSPVPLPPGIEPNPIETPAPAGGGGG